MFRHKDWLFWKVTLYDFNLNGIFPIGFSCNVCLPWKSEQYGYKNFRYKWILNFTTDNAYSDDIPHGYEMKESSCLWWKILRWRSSQLNVLVVISLVSLFMRKNQKVELKTRSTERVVKPLNIIQGRKMMGFISSTASSELLVCDVAIGA